MLLTISFYYTMFCHCVKYKSIKVFTISLTTLILLFTSQTHSTEARGEFKCSVPVVRTADDTVDLARFKSDFTKISEVKFPGLIGPLSEKLFCKIKCIDGYWVGPLCSNSPDGRFQPILRECIFKNEYSLLAVAFNNSTIDEEAHFSHGSDIVARCKHFGLYKLKGDNTLRCKNGEWIPKFPECVPTNIITNFTGDAPPSIQYTIVSGSGVVDHSGQLLIYPDSVVRLDCISPRAHGDPEWTWTQALQHHTVAWSSEDTDKETHYGLTLNKLSARHNDHYTCTSPNGHTNTVQIKVVNVICPTVNMSSPRMRQFIQGSRLGQTIHLSCQSGYHLNGSSVLTCMGNGKWSSPQSTCVEISCPPLTTLGAHLSVVEYNSSFGGHVVFQCAWGYKLVGVPGLECEPDGKWSGAVPTCSPIYCHNPHVPENGRLLTTSSAKEVKFPVGDLVIYACEDGYQILGESSIVCTENGFWSHPPPFCLTTSEIRKDDVIRLDNTTFIQVED